jgi:outer membrane protein assembly factor BamD (BamD/ComL family)
MRLFRSIARVLLPSAVLLAGAPPGFAQEQGSIQGRVFLEGTRNPVAGAVVRAEPPRFAPDGTRETLARPLETVTDANGRFALNWMRSGIWTTTVTIEGFEPSALRIEVTQGESHACSATQLRRCVQPIEFYLARLEPGADRTVERALGQAGLGSRELQQAKADLTAADAAYNRGDYRAAIDGYARLLAAWPQMTVLHQDIGDAHRALAEFEDALAAYERFLAAEPDDEAIMRKIARTKLLTGNLDAAQELAAAAGSASREDLYNLGEVEFSNGNVDAAAAWYEKAAAADPAWPPPVLKLGLVALNRGDLARAKTLFQQVIKLAPDSEEGAQAKSMLEALP